MQDRIDIRLRSLTWEAPDVLSFEFVPVPPATSLPPFTAGAHLSFRLDPGPGQAQGRTQVRDYSLLNDPAETHRYRVAVHQSPNGRGGAHAMHQLRPGTVLSVRSPRNLFPLDESAEHYVLIAGGIGITPLLSMAARLNTLGKRWTFYYACRSRNLAALLPELQGLAAVHGNTLHLHWDDEHGGAVLNLPALVADYPIGTPFYACGPQPMLTAFEIATEDRPRSDVHYESFGAAPAVEIASAPSTTTAANPEPVATTTDTHAAAPASYTLHLAKTGLTLNMAAHQNILDTLLDAGLDLTYSCQQGICGTCEVRVLDGVPDHHDMVLTEAEKAANDRMLICCSGCKSPSLTLDL